ncbi:MAG: 30S ribosome-binding factor RbfA [Alphaproteobacteria bacterium]
MTLSLFHQGKPLNHRQKRVAHEVKCCLAKLFTRCDLPARCDKNGNLLTLLSPITVTDVKLSPDFKHATVFVMPLLGKHKEEIMAFLDLSAGYLRKLVGKTLTIKNTPSLRFCLDKGFENVEKIDKVLKEIKIS